MRLIRRLDLYVIREILGPLSLGLLVYTFILLLQLLFRLAEMIIRRGLSLDIVARLLGFSIPNILVLTIPMSLLFGILIAAGRLASDSELIAMRANGVSLYQLYRPVLLLTLAFGLLNTYLTVKVMPEGNRQFQQLFSEAAAQDITQMVEPRKFTDRFPGKVLYVFDAPDRQHRWNGVFYAEALPSSTLTELTVADWGEIQLDEDGERVVLHLENAVTHRVDLSHPDRYETTRHRSLDLVLEEAFKSTQQARIASRGRKPVEMTLPELLARAHDAAVKPEARNGAAAEVQKRFAIPFACVAFGLVALPLGFNNRRGGKSSGFAISIGIILGYYVLLSQGEDKAILGLLPPWLGIWLPNLLLVTLGGFLLLRRNRDRSSKILEAISWGIAALAAKVSTFAAHRRERRILARRAALEQAAAAAPPRREDPLDATGAATGGTRARQLVLRLQRPHFRFPKLLDSYVLRLFGSVLLLVLLSVVSIYVISDFTENTDDIIRHQVPMGVLLGYYQLLVLQILYDFAPIVVLVTTLITFSVLSRRNEVTAFRALGVSLYRLSLPGVFAAALVMASSFYLQDRILPVASERVAQLRDVIKGRETARTYRRADRQWLFGQGRFMYNYLRYDPKAESLQRLSVFEFDERHRLTSRLVAERAVFTDGKWIFEDGWARSFSADGRPSTFSRFTDQRVVDLPEKPDFFATEIQRPEQMSYSQLRSYVALLRETGQPIPEVEVALASKLAFPVISLVMALVAMPFAFRLGRRGALYGLGVSLVLGMVFMAIFAFFRTLGQTGALPPLVAVWSPNAIFAFLAAYLFLDMKT